MSFFMLSVLVFFLATEVGISQGTDLPGRYKQWLDEEVCYIITSKEKNVFLQLTTDRERDLFIEAFWKQRDPLPESPANEFKEEHYRRISYANLLFGRNSAKPGGLTDRGRMYIILGEPQDILRTDISSALHPTETWFYQGMTGLGLPAGFHLIFYRRGSTGEYILYSPLQDGPQRLLTNYRGDPRDYLAANEMLKEADPQLGEFTLSFITGDSTVSMGRPSMASDLLVERIELTPTRRIKDLYAQKFLDYKDIIDVEYSANYIYCDTQVKLTKDLDGTYFLSYAIEPDRLSVSQFEGKYYTTLKLNGTLANSQGKILYQYEKIIPLEFDDSQMQDFSHRKLNLQDMVPVIPGHIKLSVLLQNEASKEFTSMEREVFIPGQEPELQMTPLIIGYGMRSDPRSDDRVRPFQNGRFQILFQASRVFMQKDDLWISYQIHGLDSSLRENARIKYRLYRNQEIVHAWTRELSENLELPDFVESLSLREFPPAHYEIQASLLKGDREILTSKEEFDISHAQTIARPWFYTKSLPKSGNPVRDYALGTQYFNDGQYQEAKSILQEAHRKTPESLDMALQLTRVYYALEEYAAVEALLSHFKSPAQAAPLELDLLLGKALIALGNSGEAVEVLAESLIQHGLSTLTLNTLGEAYIGLGNIEEALKALEKSLEIDPDQVEIQSKVERLRKKNHITRLA